MLRHNSGLHLHYTADILDYKLTETEDEFRLSVVSFVRSDEDASEKE